MVTVVTVTILVLGREEHWRLLRGRVGERGSKSLPFHRSPIPKRLFAYTQTAVRLYPN